MSGFCDKSEPILMSDEILQKAVDEQTPQNHAGRVDKAEGKHFNDVLKIRLEYLNILKISHLRDFTSLTRLDLNNNLIERIEGLDHLLNLTWLNLSFNRIKKIEGLESLRKLELLNLSDNKISVVENMDELEKMTNFSFANNLLEQLDSVLYLKKFKNLFTLNLYGNPVSKEDDYTLFIAAHFPNLMFLDYRLLNEKTKKEASIKYYCVTEETRHEELQKQQVLDAEKRQKAELQLHTDAFVEFLNGSYLFKSMVKDDPEAETLHCVAGVAPLLQTFEQQMVALCVQLFEAGMAEHKQREAEVNSFLSGQTQAVTDYQQRAAQILAEFEQQHKEMLLELQQLSDPDIVEVKVSHHSNEIEQLCTGLMSLEFQLVSQLEEIIKKLEINISDMVANFTESVQGIFAQCRELQDNYHRKVHEIAVATLKKVAMDNRDEDMPDEVRMLFMDKDTVMDALATAHDNHLQKINDRETQLVTRVDAWRVALIKEIQDKELKRNRACVSDILRYTDYLREQLFHDFLPHPPEQL
ncbi:dynein regulatory complex subunit 3 [Solea solea]|uniref:dynein regulatory complex subunit 3 n=1 Tax=Solea solea TaxID=90069 RepID=UPI00272C2548|nr:dynein regulatory complex subunit 3 [Solea solea]